MVLSLKHTMPALFLEFSLLSRNFHIASYWPNLRHYLLHGGRNQQHDNILSRGHLPTSFSHVPQSCLSRWWHPVTLKVSLSFHCSCLRQCLSHRHRGTPGTASGQGTPPGLNIPRAIVPSLESSSGGPPGLPWRTARSCRKRGVLVIPFPSFRWRGQPGNASVSLSPLPFSLLLRLPASQSPLKLCPGKQCSQLGKRRAALKGIGRSQFAASVRFMRCVRRLVVLKRLPSRGDRRKPEVSAVGHLVDSRPFAERKCLQSGVLKTASRCHQEWMAAISWRWQGRLHLIPGLRWTCTCTIYQHFENERFRCAKKGHLLTHVYMSPHGSAVHRTYTQRVHLQWKS